LRGPRPVVDLCSGPAKLCEAFDITRKLDGADLEGDVVWIEDDGFVSGHIDRSTRVGLSQGRELPLRFFLPDSPFVSRGKPSAPLVIGTS
jgi:DNA-3-methyladenine glycosylase